MELNHQQRAPEGGNNLARGQAVPAAGSAVLRSDLAADARQGRRMGF
jgi:hypothetical protein